MAQELKQTTSKIYTEPPEFLEKSDFIATIGDICTIKIIEKMRIPDLMIVDYKTKRNVELTNEQKKVIDNINCKTVKIDNKAGTISEELYLEIEKAINSDEKTRIVVIGEEDIAT